MPSQLVQILKENVSGCLRKIQSRNHKVVGNVYMELLPHIIRVVRSVIRDEFFYITYIKVICHRILKLQISSYIRRYIGLIHF